MAEAVQQQAPPAAPKAPEYGPVTLADRYLIFPSQPLEDLDVSSAKAYLAEDKRDPGHHVFALICPPGFAPRVSVMTTLKTNVIRGLMQLVDWDVVDWPIQGRRVMGVVYERPMGGRVANRNGQSPHRISEYDLPRKVIEPVTKALKDLANRNLSHRAIRPDNLFYLDAERNSVVLGDCVTMPPGFDQPQSYESIERSMCNRAGRGRGNIADDIFAFGVTLVNLMLGGNPVGRMDEDGLFHARVEHGSYATICGSSKVPVSLLEPLRGMLSDDPHERWTVDELELWLAGKRQTPIQRKPAQKTAVPLNFMGREHYTGRTLSRAMTRNVPEAMKIIDDGTLANWVRRNLENPELSEFITRAANEAKAQQGNLGGTPDYVVCKVAMHMDPNAPMRYKGLAFMPEAYGPLLAYEMIVRSNSQTVAEILLHGVPSLWFEAQNTRIAESSQLAKNFNTLRQFLTNRDPGYGLERCLYELNSTLPCQSPLLISDYVVGVDEMLPHLDSIAGNIDSKKRPLDRHITALIASRFDEDIDPHLRALADPKESINLIGMLSLLAFLQWKLKSEPLYGLASWVGGLLGPAINTYHSRSTRREIEREIPKLVRQGSLPELFDLIDNPERRKADVDGYQAARAQFHAAELEVREIKGGGDEGNRSAKHLKVGQQSAAMTSVVISMMIVAVLFFMETW